MDNPELSAAATDLVEAIEELVAGLNQLPGFGINTPEERLLKTLESALKTYKMSVFRDIINEGPN